MIFWIERKLLNAFFVWYPETAVIACNNISSLTSLDICHYNWGTQIFRLFNFIFQILLFVKFERYSIKNYLRILNYYPDYLNNFWMTLITIDFSSVFVLNFSPIVEGFCFLFDQFIERTFIDIFSWVCFEFFSLH